MTLEIGLLLGILSVALVFFSTDWIPPGVVGLGVLASMVLTGPVPSDRALAGFGSDTFVMILGLLILVAALIRTGVVEVVGQAILRRTGDRPGRVLWMVTVAGARAFGLFCALLTRPGLATPSGSRSGGQIRSRCRPRCLPGRSFPRAGLLDVCAASGELRLLQCIRSTGPAPS